MISLIGKFYTWLVKGQFYFFGKNSTIQPILNTANARYISIGEDVNIGAMSRISVSTEFGSTKVKSNNQIKIKIGNHVDIGNNAFISGNNNIIIGEHVIMSSYIFITDHDHGFANIEKSIHEQPLSENGHTIIENNVFLGTKCSILKNVTIGQRSIIAANSVVTRDVPPFSIVAGNPAKIIKKYDFDQKKWISTK